MIARINEVKTLLKHISCDCKCKFDSTTCNSNQKQNNDNCQYKCKKYCTCKKDYSWDTGTHICENSSYLKNDLVIVCNSVIMCDKIISVTDSL